ncbi:putative cation/H+ exchanger, CPA1 family, na+/H+ exchanger NHX -type [Helianthus annuus]|nr:putative cation/H+ exchanger, CPA1 family [Helianthus annuus]KAJ0861969.1 putative cation/H+ exchanger, CPA1 family, na+/H+ exchanger NHX -type [Helianthus annuus]
MGFDLGFLVGKMGSTTLATSEYSSVVSMNLFVALLCACIVIGHLLEENQWMNESITTLVIVSVCARAELKNKSWAVSAVTFTIRLLRS